jgi:YD repeat-containing protein
MDDAPIFSVSRRHGDNSQQNEFRAAPVEGSYVRGKWQRWEARIPHADLVANGMFADSANDYLRFFVASIDTNPAFDPSRVIHVDDIVLRPDDAMFSLTAYDRGGRPTQRTDANHLTITQEYGFAGQPTVTRDERGRILGQSGLNKPGEN